MCSSQIQADNLQLHMGNICEIFVAAFALTCKHSEISKLVHFDGLKD